MGFVLKQQAHASPGRKPIHLSFEDLGEFF
jgi:hypothetical protein